MHTNKIRYYLMAHFKRKKTIFLPNVNFSRTASLCTATIDTFDVFTNELLQRNNTKIQFKTHLLSGNQIKCYFSKSEKGKSKDYAEMNDEEIDNEILDCLDKVMDKQILNILTFCCDHSKLISDNTLKRSFRTYSVAGKPEVVVALQKYCYSMNYNFYRRNGEFLHYLAKAHCFKGNAEKGLTILSTCYSKNDGLRGFYRVIFRELIHDSVMNRSEATLVVFKKYVLEFSTRWNDNYPLVCFWHKCWCSSWYSDQVLANELLETSENLQNVIKERATTLSIDILKEYNDDAVMRLLQSLLKYKMMKSYANVLQVLFDYKLRNRDLRGCMEIIRNCETLGISLPSDQQGRYIRMLIDNKAPREKQLQSKIISKDFKLKF